ncbi:MAG: myo-inosose-2 dehydratase [Hyphomicrobiaceae bacterium]
MTIRIGANPIIWSNDDLPELGGDISLERCLSEARAAGYEGMELGNKFPRSPEALRAALAPYGLAVVSGWYSTFLLERSAEDEMAAAAAHRALLKAMGAQVFIVAECTRTVHGLIGAPLSQRPVMTDAEWTRFLARLDTFARLLADDGLRLVYHHHIGTVVQSADEIERMMRGTSDAVGLLLDTGHATWAGADPAALARAWRTRIGHVHVKDVRPAIAARAIAEDWSFLIAVKAGVYTVPGDGAIDFVAVLRELGGYEGWIVVEAEQDPSQAHPGCYARLGFDNLSAALAAA